MDPDATLALLAEILRGTVARPGAACIGREILFDPLDDTYGRDPNTDYQRAAAAEVCRRCPHRQVCPYAVPVDTPASAA